MKHISNDNEEINVKKEETKVLPENLRPIFILDQENEKLFVIIPVSFQYQVSIRHHDTLAYGYVVCYTTRLEYLELFKQFTNTEVNKEILIYSFEISNEYESRSVESVENIIETPIVNEKSKELFGTIFPFVKLTFEKKKNTTMSEFKL